MKSFAKLAVVVALAVGASSASAATSVYTGYDPSPGGSLAVNPNSTAVSNSFNAQLTGTSSESFETFAVGSSTPLNLSFTGSAGPLSATLTGPGKVESATRAFPAVLDLYATDLTKYYKIEEGNLTVTFTSAIAAFGFFAADLEAASFANITLNYVAGGSQTYNLETLFGYTSGDYAPTGFLPSGGVHFIGFINAANPFSSVVYSGNVNDTWAFDQMTIGDQLQVTGSVPEPATWAMMIVGFGLIGGAMRRRSAKIGPPLGTARSALSF